MEEMKLRVDPATLTTRYQTAAPFPHIVIDDLFPDDELQLVLDDFPRPDSTAWARFDNPQERKLGFHHERTSVSHRIQRFLWLMNSHVMLDFLEKLTGIDGLIPDPYFGGGGIHQIETGGFLKVHADFNWHPKLRLDRRLNLLIYLNKDWKESYGGSLELWDSGMRECVQSVAPVFNRTVVFSTTDSSYHGHPRPLATPPGVTRKSVSLYYYTNGRPESEKSAPHDTVFRKTADDEW